jgi:hypothetical protein
MKIKVTDKTAGNYFQHTEDNTLYTSSRIHIIFTYSYKDVQDWYY